MAVFCAWGIFTFKKTSVFYTLVAKDIRKVAVSEESYRKTEKIFLKKLNVLLGC